MILRSVGWCGLYALLGVVQDVIIARYYICVSRREAFRASIWAFLITALTVWVIGSVVVSNSVILILCYAVGTAVGTGIGVKYGSNKSTL